MSTNFNSIASFGQTATHAPQAMQVLSIIAFPLTIVIESVGHTLIHNWQDSHLDSSTTAMTFVLLILNHISY